MIGSFITMHARLAVREIAKVFGVPPGEVNRFTKRLPHRPVREILQAIRNLPECRDLPVNEEPWKTILQVALRLDDAPRHLGIHPCGTVISARPLTQLVPLERAAKGIVVTQYDMNAVEALGLIKMDLLGQRGFTTMSLALDNVDRSAVTHPVDRSNHLPVETGLQPGSLLPAVVAGLQTGSFSFVENNEPMAFATPKTNHKTVIPSGAPALSAGAQSRNLLSMPNASPAVLANSQINQKSVIPTGGPMVCIGPERRDLSSISTISTNASAIAPDGVTPCPTARNLDFDSIPENDPATCDVIAAGRTMGVFQIESPAMRGMLRMMNARTLEQIAIALAIIRPGASEYGSKELFVKRLRGEEPVIYTHDSLKPILRDTLGVCIYQEQVMQIAQAVGSMSLAEADLVRRSSVKYSGRADRDRLRGKFEKAAAMIGLTKPQLEETWLMVEKFAGFGFCKAHAATYADISYRMAYLKTHHTAEFLAAMCSSGAGFYHVSAYVEEAKRWGIPVLLPSVNHSLMQYTTEPSLECGGLTPLSSSSESSLECGGSLARSLVRRSLSGGGSLGLPAWAGEGGPLACPERSRGVTSLRVGLMQIRGLRLETITNIVREREANGLYRSLEDFLRRVPVERDEIEALIKCGAFDDVCSSTRPALLWQWNLLQEKFRRGPSPQSADSLFGDSPAPSPAETLAGFATSEYTLEQKLRYEREILEVCVSGHPLDFLPRHVDRFAITHPIDRFAITHPIDRFAITHPIDRFAITHSNEVVWSDELPARIGKRVTLCGWVVTYRHVGTKNYRNMMFVTLEDQRGIYEAVLFPEAYERYGGLIFETRALCVTGRVEPSGQLNCDHMEALAKTPPAAESSRSGTKKQNSHGEW